MLGRCYVSIRVQKAQIKAIQSGNAEDKVMESGNNQNVKVVIPPRHGRTKPAKAQPVQESTQPVRVSIPPRHGRTPAMPQQEAAPQRLERASASEPVQIRIPPRASRNPGSAQNQVGAQNRSGAQTQVGAQIQSGMRNPGSAQNRSGAQTPGVVQRGVRAEMSFEQLAQLASSVVMIMVHDKKGETFASGSGIMIGRKGYILTNNHVLSEGSFFTVRIENDENCYRADQIIKYNHVLDLAVIRIDRALDPLPVYSGPQKLVRGQKVVAIGSPLGLFNSVSDGIIAGFRVLDDVDMIQFTAPTSPGSSGGAVLNMYGEVIGISTAGAPGAQGINWAVGYEFINLFTQGFRND